MYAWEESSWIILDHSCKSLVLARIFLSKIIGAMEGDGQLEGLCGREEVHALGLYRLERRGLVYFGLICVLRNLWELKCWLVWEAECCPGTYPCAFIALAWGCLLLRIWTKVSMVGWNILGLLPVGDFYL